MAFLARAMRWATFRFAPDEVPYPEPAPEAARAPLSSTLDVVPYGEIIDAVAAKHGVPADLVRQLSYDRADSVRKSILTKYKFDPNKFKVIGNGWDNPVPGMTDASNLDHNKKNRRVEVKVFPLEKE